jgi:hypothetical protein
MLRRIALSLVCLSACGSQPASTPQAGSSAKAAPVAKPEAKRAALMNSMAEMLAESKEVAAAYVEGKLGDRLLADQMVLIDGNTPKGTEHAQYYLLPGDFNGPTSTAADLQQAARADHGTIKRAIIGGEDHRLGLVRGVAPGKYIACAALGPLSPPGREAYLKRSKELLGEGGPGKADPKKLAEVAKQAREETGYTPQKRDWTKIPASCKPIEVTTDMASRVVVFEPPAGAAVEAGPT